MKKIDPCDWFCGPGSHLSFSSLSFLSTLYTVIWKKTVIRKMASFFHVNSSASLHPFELHAKWIRSSENSFFLTCRQHEPNSFRSIAWHYVNVLNCYVGVCNRRWDWDCSRLISAVQNLLFLRENNFICLALWSLKLCRPLTFTKSYITPCFAPFSDPNGHFMLMVICLNNTVVKLMNINGCNSHENDLKLWTAWSDWRENSAVA